MQPVFLRHLREWLGHPHRFHLCLAQGGSFLTGAALRECMTGPGCSCSSLFLAGLNFTSLSETQQEPRVPESFIESLYTAFFLLLPYLEPLPLHASSTLWDTDRRWLQLASYWWGSRAVWLMNWFSERRFSCWFTIGMREKDFPPRPECMFKKKKKNNNNPHLIIFIDIFTCKNVAVQFESKCICLS